MPYGYTVTSQCNIITIEARDGLGSSINGDHHLFVVITENSGSNIITENEFVIDTENNNSLIVE
jgi:hypothetical protein